MTCTFHDLQVIGLNPCQVKLGVHSTSVQVVFEAQLKIYLQYGGGHELIVMKNRLPLYVNHIIKIIWHQFWVAKNHVRAEIWEINVFFITVLRHVLIFTF